MTRNRRPVPILAVLAGGLAGLLAGGFGAPAEAASDTALRLNNVNGANTSFQRVPTQVEFELQQFTLEAWVQRVGAGYGFTTDIGGSGIISKSAEGTTGSHLGSWHMCYLNDGRVNFNLTHTVQATGQYLLSPALADPLARHHIAATFDGDSMRVVIDGVEAAASMWTLGSVYYGANDVLIGANNFGAGYLRRFDGWIDEARIWSYARTPQQIAATMNCRLSGGEPGLVAYWTYDGSDLVDLTGHGHDGLVGGVVSSLTYGPLVSLGACTVGVPRSGEGAEEIVMSVFPQPTQGAFHVRFALPEAAPVTLDAFDVAGRRVARLSERDFPAGIHEIGVDVAALAARRASGVLYLRLDAGGRRATRAIVIAGDARR